jgi:3-phosphoshikimate 1-carboxyvinyltransferase
MLSAIAEGTRISAGFLEGEDTRATAAVLSQLACASNAIGRRARVHGVGLHGLRGSSKPLDCGNAGTGMRLLTGLLAGQAFDSTLIGDESLSKRPMRRVTDPLAQMGAQIDTPMVCHRCTCMVADIAWHPLRIAGGQRAGQIGAAAGGLYAKGSTEVIEPHPTRDYTERMLAAFGWPIEFRRDTPSWKAVIVARHDVEVPADFSSAAFFLVAASIVPGSIVRLPAVGLNPRRTGLLQALRLMGADIVIENPRESGGEPVGDLVVRYAPLHGIELPEALVPDMIDEFPALFIAAAVAKGRTIVRGAAELRVKESDRIATMAAGLRALARRIEETPTARSSTAARSVRQWKAISTTASR